jgi:alpha-L-rhamnosidase
MIQTPSFIKISSYKLKQTLVLCFLFFALVVSAKNKTGKSLGQENPSSTEQQAITICDLRTEGVVQPLGVEEELPRFSWRYEGSTNADRGFRQVACRVIVSSSPEKLKEDVGDMWDSGRKEETGTLSFIYGGKPLLSTARYYWKVIGYSDNGKSYVSKPQYFEMGLMKGQDWKNAQWISARAERPKTIPALLQEMEDYAFNAKFKIRSGSAFVLTRATYCVGGGYQIELQPGRPGKVILTSKTPPAKGEKNKPPKLGEWILEDGLELNSWNQLRVECKKNEIQIWVNEKAVNAEPVRDESFKKGTMALGASPKGIVQWDDFSLTSSNGIQVADNFDDNVLFSFQNFFFSPTSYSVVKEGVLEVESVTACLEPKKGLEAPRFRKTFEKSNTKKVVRARAYVAGLGYYTFWLNGKRLDDYYLQPGFARYNKTAYYTAYDVTEHLQAKKNILAFELGRGWYGMTTPTLWGETFSKDWMAEPALRVLVTIDYADGTQQTVVSDSSFKTATGPILFESVKAGEIYDARKQTPDWNRIHYSDSKWRFAVPSVGKMPVAAPGLTCQLFEPIRVVEQFTPQNIEKIEDEKDAWLIDFGMNMAGIVQMRFKGKPGQVIRMQYLELHREKSKGTPSRERWDNFGALATGSFQTNVYIAKGGADEVYEPSYSYNGFRYIRVEGLTEKPTKEQFIAKAINSDMVQVGKFESSSELWNKIWEAGRRCIQGNMHSIPTDCPQWEKLGWTCDDAGPYYAMAYNYDLRKLYDKRLQDYADDISPEGKLRYAIPCSWGSGENSDPAWVGSYVNLVWKHYQTYGDIRTVQRHYVNLKKYMETLIKNSRESKSPPLLTTPMGGLGDWGSQETSRPIGDGALIYNNLYFYRYLTMMTDMSTLLNKPEDISYYGNIGFDVKKAFNRYIYDDSTNGSYYTSLNKEATFQQAPQAIALAFRLVPEEKIRRVTQRLVQNIRERNGHSWAGILGVEAMADALCEYGQTDMAYEIHLKDDFPSLGHMIRKGATTLWENLDTDNERSLNHKMFASPLGWMARYVAGLKVDGIMGNGPGFRNVIIQPHVSPSQMQFVSFAYDSPVGKYKSHWQVNGEGVVYDLTIPPNGSATVRLPLLGKSLVSVSESGKEIWKDGKTIGAMAGGKDGHLEEQAFVIALGSGTYSFQVKTK